MTTARILIPILFGLIATAIHAEEPYTPKPGSNERKAICDGLRSFIISEYAEKKLPKPVILKIEYLKVVGDYCWIEALPMFEDGSDAVPQFLPDIGYVHCLKRFSNWHVILDLSRTDVPGPDERAKIKKSFPGDFPMELLSPGWKEIFAGKFD